MISVEDPTKLKAWNKSLKGLMMDMNSSYSNLNIELVSIFVEELNVDFF